MKPAERIAELEKELTASKEREATLLKKISEMETSKKETSRPASKSRLQAEEGLKMLQQGPVTKEQFAKLNSKYPSDIPYYIKNILKIDVKTVRTANGSVYMLLEEFQKYQEGLAEEKKKAAAAKAEVKAEAKESLQAQVAQVVGQGITAAQQPRA